MFSSFIHRHRSGPSAREHLLLVALVLVRCAQERRGLGVHTSTCLAMCVMSQVMLWPIQHTQTHPLENQVVILSVLPIHSSVSTTLLLKKTFHLLFTNTWVWSFFVCRYNSHFKRSAFFTRYLSALCSNSGERLSERVHPRVNTSCFPSRGQERGEERPGRFQATPPSLAMILNIVKAGAGTG